MTIWAGIADLSRGGEFHHEILSESEIVFWEGAYRNLILFERCQ